MRSAYCRGDVSSSPNGKDENALLCYVKAAAAGARCCVQSLYEREGREKRKEGRMRERGRV